MNNKGFMLVEVALVIMLVAIILGPVLHLLSSQSRKDEVLQQLRTKQQISEAVEGFVLATGRLPCPATEARGKESRTGDACTNSEGWLPAATLNTWNITGSWRMAVATLDQAGEPALNTLISNQPFAELSPQQLAEIVLAPYTANYSLGTGPLPAIHLCQQVSGLPLPVNTQAGCANHTLLSPSAVWVAYPVESSANINSNRYQQFFITPDQPALNPAWISFERMNWLWMKRGSLEPTYSQEN